MILYDPDDVEKVEKFGKKRKIEYITSAINEARNKFQADINAEEKSIGAENIERPMTHYLLEFPKGYKLSAKDIYAEAGDLNKCEMFMIPVTSETLKHHYDEEKRKKNDKVHKTFLTGFTVALKSAGKRAPTGKVGGPKAQVPQAAMASEGMFDEDSSEDEDLLST